MLNLCIHTCKHTSIHASMQHAYIHTSYILYACNAIHSNQTVHKINISNLHNPQQKPSYANRNHMHDITAAYLSIVTIKLPDND